MYFLFMLGDSLARYRSLARNSFSVRFFNIMFCCFQELNISLEKSDIFFNGLLCNSPLTFEESCHSLAVRNYMFLFF